MGAWIRTRHPSERNRITNEIESSGRWIPAPFGWVAGVCRVGGVVHTDSVDGAGGRHFGGNAGWFGARGACGAAASGQGAGTTRMWFVRFCEDPATAAGIFGIWHSGAEPIPQGAVDHRSTMSWKSLQRISAIGRVLALLADRAQYSSRCIRFRQHRSGPLKPSDEITKRPAR